MDERLKILLCIPHLGGGGAERVTSLLARALGEGPFEVHLCLIDEDAKGAETLPSTVTVHRLGARRVRQSWRPMLRLVWRIRPAIVLSNMAHLNFLILLLKPLLPLKTKVIVRQNTTASAAARSAFHRQLYLRLYPKADKVVCQSQPMADDLVQHFRISPERLVVLSNPIDIEGIRSNYLSEVVARGPGPELLAVGRLAPEKGLDLLLDALPVVRLQFPHLQLIIAGSGPEEGLLQARARRLDILDAVTFAGYVSDLSNAYRRADLFVLCSRNEGMPNALLEAAAVGLPLVATPCCRGVVELLQDSPGAWLARAISADAMAEAILAALRNYADFSADRLAPRCEHRFLAPFSLPTAVGAYKRLLEEVAVKK